MKFIDKKCESCNKIFTLRYKYRKRRRFCSVKCGVNSLNRHKAERVISNCAKCNKEIEIVGVRLKRSKSNLYFCNRECRQKYGLRRQDFVKQARLQAVKYFGESSIWKCSICGYNKCSGAVEVHHIDRNRKNNSEDNLILLCANCHIEEHYNANDGKFGSRSSAR